MVEVGAFFVMDIPEYPAEGRTGFTYVSAVPFASGGGVASVLVLCFASFSLLLGVL